MEITRLKSTRGHEAIVVEGYKYTYNRTTLSGDIAWRCTNRECGFLIFTDSTATTLVNYNSDNIGKSHTHAPLTTKVIEKLIVMNRCKKKCIEEIDMQPRYITAEVLQATHLSAQDLSSLKNAIYRERRKHLAAGLVSYLSFFSVLLFLLQRRYYEGEYTHVRGVR